jgi:tellurite resistance protein TerC
MTTAPTSMPILFPFAEYWWFYAGFIGLVIGLLVLDLGVFHRKAHVVTFRESATWSVVWVSLALLFNVGFWQYAQWKIPTDPRLAGLDHAMLANQAGLEFFTGYIVEKALAVDNIFVFAMVFAYFAVPAHLQHRVLFYGILGALVFRAIFISLGSVLMQYQWVVLLAGAFLILTGIKMALMGEQKLEPERNPLVRLVRRFLPITPTFEGQSFFVRKAGVLMATPLFLCLVFIEFSDIIFAIDSVPAIFAITREPLIVFTSNIFAILGLRAMYFMLAGIMDRFHLLKYALALILVFVGLKMVWLNDAFGGKFPIPWSLGIIAGLLTAGIVASLAIKPRKPAPESPPAP